MMRICISNIFYIYNTHFCRPGGGVLAREFEKRPFPLDGKGPQSRKATTVVIKARNEALSMWNFETRTSRRQKSLIATPTVPIGLKLSG